MFWSNRHYIPKRLTENGAPEGGQTGSDPKVPAIVYELHLPTRSPFILHKSWEALVQPSTATVSMEII